MVCLNKKRRNLNHNYHLNIGKHIAMLHMKNCIQQIYFRLKQTSERNALMQKKISSLLYCVLKSIIMHLTYLFDNKLRNVVNILFKLKTMMGHLTLWF